MCCMKISPRFLTLALILLLAAALRFHALDASSLWSDEGNSSALMARSYSQIARDAAADIHPPGYYWLLKGWTSLVGASAWGLRSLSALLGVALVAVTFAIGNQVKRSQRSVVGRRSSAFDLLPLVAATVAALHPFQIYYSQEARMYALLALESAGLLWALLGLIDEGAGEQGSRGAGGRGRFWPSAIFVICGVAGLWTHYSFPLVLLAAAAAFVINAISNTQYAVRRFVFLNALILLAFLPWLPTAVERVLNWPTAESNIPLLDGLRLTAQTLLVGPLRNVPTLGWPLLAATVALPVLGLLALRRHPTATALALWVTLPVALTIGLGFSEAFLKLLLVMSPAWCVLVAGSAEIFQRGDAEEARRKRGERKEKREKETPAFIRVYPRFIFSSFIALAALVLTAWSLPGYYADATARDNYAGVARYVAALGEPMRDLVLLNAPGQAEVWSYYAERLPIELPVLPLPQQRPPDVERTEQELADAVQGKRQIFALFWAEAQSDPERIVETWLNGHAFKGLETWQGNVRFVTYSLADELRCQPLDPAPIFGELIALNEQCQPTQPQVTPNQIVPSGGVLLLRLGWRALADIDTRYTVTVQLLDARDNVIAQRDAEPVGGSRLTDAWTAGETVEDNHGVAIPLGTPPGDYRLRVALYDPLTGARLTTADGADHVALGTVKITRPARELSTQTLVELALSDDVATRLDARLGPVTLAGYSQYRRGFAHAPETPLQAGDALHVSLYWLAPDPLPDDWPDDLSMTLELGEQSLVAPLAGGAYPTGAWLPGELVRAEFDVPFDGSGRGLSVEVVGEQVRLGRVP